MTFGHHLPRQVHDHVAIFPMGKSNPSRDRFLFGHCFLTRPSGFPFDRYPSTYQRSSCVITTSPSLSRRTAFPPSAAEVEMGRETWTRTHGL